MLAPDIKWLQVENTTRCNASCPACDRNQNGYGLAPGLVLEDLSTQRFSEVLEQFPNLETIQFCGSYGDTMAAQNVVEQVTLAKTRCKKLQIHTHGGIRSESWWTEFAHLVQDIDHDVWFCLDGLNGVHEIYRQGTDFDKTIANAKAFISAGGRAIWRFVPFKHNQHQEAKCRELAQSMGFTEFENIYDGRDSGPVFSRTGEYSHQIGTDPSGRIPHIKDLLQSHITWFDPHTVQSHKDTPELKLRCQHKLKQEIYIAADGSIYPCCYLGFYPDSMNHAGNSQTKELVQENNALKYDLAHCLAWFDRVEQTWAQNSIAEGRLYQCVNSCAIT